MMTEKEFRASKMADELLALLNQPVLKLALEIVGEEARPRGYIEPRPHAHYDTLVAQKYHKQAGLQAALDHLRRLTLPPAPEEEKEDELEGQPYFNSLPEDMKNALRQQKQQRNDL